MHFAAYSLVPESVEDPARYFINNLSNGLVLLEAMRRAGTKRMVFSSTAAVYGVPERPLIDESHPTTPINPYGETKLFFEKALARYRRAYGIDYVSLRYFNAAGACADLGEDHRPETHLIPRVLAVAAGRGGRVKIFGDDYETPDGTCVRDYIHVGDLAAAHILALGCPGGRIYNLGNGRGFSVREVIETARKVTGEKIETEPAPRRPGDPPVLVASSERIRGELGWRPGHPDLEDIIGSAWDWMRAHPGGYTD
jgi:UDP-glucose 4-epimerase